MKENYFEKGCFEEEKARSPPIAVNKPLQAMRLSHRSFLTTWFPGVFRSQVQVKEVLHSGFLEAAVKVSASYLVLHSFPGAPADSHDC